MLELGTLGQNARSGHNAKLIGRSQADKTTEVFQVILIRAACPRVVQVSKPLHCGGNLGLCLKFNRREPTLIVLMGFRQFLLIVLMIDSLETTENGFSHKIALNRVYVYETYKVLARSIGFSSLPLIRMNAVCLERYLFSSDKA